MPSPLLCIYISVSIPTKHLCSLCLRGGGNSWWVCDARGSCLQHLPVKCHLRSRQWVLVLLCLHCLPVRPLRKIPPCKSGHWDLWAYKLCPSLHTCSCFAAPCLQWQDDLGLAVPLDSKWVCPNLFSAVLFREGQKLTQGLCLISHPKAG